jgi:2'-5' RNA ligase
MTTPNTMRAFLALEIPQQILASLEMLITKLKGHPGAEKVRWVKTRSMHLTLKFLGDIDINSVPLIEGGLQAAVAGQSSIQLRLSELGCFPNASKPRVLWIGIGGEIKALHQLQARVENELMIRGFDKEMRAYHPHLTLGRVRRGVSKSELTQVSELLTLAPPSSPVFEVDELILFESVLQPEGPIYQAQANAPLGG